jgi:predicted ATPase
MRQHGLLRPLRASELSDGTLRYIMLCAALLAPGRPEMLVFNEPEASLHPSLLAPLARLLSKSARSGQIVIVSHSMQLVAALADAPATCIVRLEKDCGETFIQNDPDDDAPRWAWPKR